DNRVVHVWLQKEGVWKTFRRDLPRTGRRPGCWMTLAPDGCALVIGESTGRIEFWDPAGPRCLGSLHGPRLGMTALAFSPDVSTFALATQDGVIRLWPWRQLLED